MSHRTFDDPHGISDEARQFLLDNRCESKPKNHGTGKRRSRERIRKKQAAARLNAKKAARWKRKKDQIIAYWRGDVDEHPKLP